MIQGKRIIVTGASGFIGRALVSRLREAQCGEVLCLSRSAGSRLPADSGRSFKWVRGDILQPDGFREELRGSDVVFHLAASTGNSSEEVHRRVNYEGTRLLTDACREAGVRRMIYVSSIAAAYKDLSDYPYARSKRDAEQVVESSGLDATIVRPTIVLGKGSPIAATLLKLAALPLVPVFGKGTVRIQPIHVDDVARGLVESAVEAGTIGEIVELGGPQVITWDDFFRLARQVSGKGKTRLIHLPLWFVLPVLRSLERVAGSRMPVTAGQLSAFRHEGTSNENFIHDRLKPEMRNLEEMIAGSMDSGEEK